MLETRVESRETLSPPTTVAYLFPGQGSQYEGMGRQLVEESQAAKTIFNRADTHLGTMYEDHTLSDICFNNPDQILSRTIYAQPGIYTHSVARFEAIHEVLGDFILPAYVAGHSMGEFPAYVSAGGLEFEEGLDIVCKRAELMDKAGEMMERPGGMGVVSGMTIPQIEGYIDNATVYIANVNAQKQIVFSGYKDKVAELVERIKVQAIEERTAIRARILDISIAAHSPFMAPVVEEFRDFLMQYDFREPNIPIILNRTNDVSTDPNKIRDAFADQLIHGINWVTMQARLKQLGVDGLIEVGPSDVLTQLARKADFNLPNERILASDKL